MLVPPRGTQRRPGAGSHTSLGTQAARYLYLDTWMQQHFVPLDLTFSSFCRCKILPGGYSCGCVDRSSGSS